MKNLIALLFLATAAHAGDLVSKDANGAIYVSTGIFDNLCVNSSGPGQCGVLKAGASTNYRVGIGTLNPQYLLDVNGAANFTSAALSVVTVTSSLTVTGSGGIQVGTDGAAAHITTNGTSAIFGTVVADAIYVNGTLIEGVYPFKSDSYIRSVGSVTVEGGGGLGATYGITAATITATSTMTAGTANITYGIVAGSATITGFKNGSDAPAGVLGEYMSNNLALNKTPVATGDYVAIATVTLTAGDWDVYATGYLAAGGTSAIQEFIFGISNVNTTNDTNTENNTLSGYNPVTVIAASEEFQRTFGPRRVSITSTTPYYLMARITYTTLGTANFPANKNMIRARRIR